MKRQMVTAPEKPVAAIHQPYVEVRNILRSDFLNVSGEGAGCAVIFETQEITLTED